MEDGDTFVSGCVHLLFDWNYFLVEERYAEKRAAVSLQWKTAFKRPEEDVQEDFAVKFSVENCFIVP